MTLISERSRAELPTQLTTFIGREREIDELRRLVATTRLITITGPGGSGKTRLALEVAGQHSEDQPVAWVELAPLQDPSHLHQRIADACGINEEIRAGNDALLASFLRNRALLLLLDNCEHMVDACAATADALLRACPDLRILATSREALGVSGERAWLVPAMPGTDAVQLFATRAGEVAGHFDVTESNRAILEEICTRLDGIPLAIELAAARIRVLTPEQVRDRIGDAFRLLKSTARMPIPRHRTLAAAIDWSYDLLAAPERALFQQISVYHGGFTLDAVERLMVDDGKGEDVLEVLARLVDRSLVSVHEHDGVARYSLLEVVRQYARQKLEESGHADAVQRRHAHYIRALVVEAEPHFIRPERPRWIARLLPELENIRAALNFSRVADPQLHIELAGSLWWFWYSTRHWTEAGVILDQALALPEAAEATRERARLLFARGALASLQAKPQEARSYLEDAVRIARACDDQLHAYCQNYLAMTYAGESRAEGNVLCMEALAWFRQHDDQYGERLAYLLLGTTATNAGDLAAGERWTGKGLAIAREFGQPRELSIALHMHAWVQAELGNIETAKTLVLESLSASRQDPSFFSVANALDLLADITGQQGDALRAARIFGAAEQVRAVIGARRFPYAEKHFARTVPGIRAKTSDIEFDGAWAEGRKLSYEDILAEVLQPAGIVATATAGRPLRESPAPRARLRVCALGPFEVSVDGKVVAPDLWVYDKPKQLLAYLLLHPHGNTRDHIARALWPAATPSQLKNSFHVTLHHLRKALGHADWVIADEQHYRLAPDLDYESDIERFEESARRALALGDASALQQALELYRGDLLHGEVVGDWVEEHSSRLQRLHLQLTLALAAALEQNGHAANAAELYQQLIARDDLQEEPHRRLLAYWARTGERPRALKHYERLVATLRATLDAEPERETVELYRRILASDPV